MLPCSDVPMLRCPYVPMPMPMPSLCAYGHNTAPSKYGNSPSPCPNMAGGTPLPGRLEGGGRRSVAHRRHEEARPHVALRLARGRGAVGAASRVPPGTRTLPPPATAHPRVPHSLTLHTRLPVSRALRARLPRSPAFTRPSHTLSAFTCVKSSSHSLWHVSGRLRQPRSVAGLARGHPRGGEGGARGARGRCTAEQRRAIRLAGIAHRLTSDPNPNPNPKSGAQPKSSLQPQTQPSTQS